MLQFIDSHSEHEEIKMASINLSFIAKNALKQTVSDFICSLYLFQIHSLALSLPSLVIMVSSGHTYKTYAFLFQWVISRPLLPWKQWSPKTRPDPIGTGFCQL